MVLGFPLPNTKLAEQKMLFINASGFSFESSKTRRLIKSPVRVRPN